MITDVTGSLKAEELQPVSDYVLIQVMERGVSGAGIIIPYKEKSECLYGRVIRVGLGECNPITGEYYPIGVKPGDIVMSVQYMGEKIQAIGKKFRLIREHGIWAKLKIEQRSELDWSITELEPYRDHVLLRMDREEKSLKGRVFLPQNPQTMFRLADVVSVGPGIRNNKSGTVAKVGVNAGERVICLRYAGCVVKVNGVEHRLASENDLEAVIDLDAKVDVHGGKYEGSKPVDDYEVIPDSQFDEWDAKTMRDSK